MKTVKQVREEAFRILSKKIDMKSKWAQDDLSSLRAHLQKKTKAELLVTLARTNAVSQVSEAECRRHCQL